MRPQGRISVNPAVRSGKPCIKGTRIAVEDILELIEAGLSFAQIRKDHYRTISDGEIRACLGYARAILGNEEVHVVGEAA